MQFESTEPASLLFLATAEQMIHEGIDKGLERVENPNELIAKGVQRTAKKMREEIKGCPTCLNEVCPLHGSSSQEEATERILHNFMYYSANIAMTAAQMPVLLEAFMETAKDMNERGLDTLMHKAEKALRMLEDLNPEDSPQ